MTDLNPWLKAVVGPERQELTFNKLEELEDWLALQRQTWSWLKPQNNSQLGNHAASQVQKAQSNLQNQFQVLRQQLGTPQEQSHITQMSNVLSQHHGPDGIPIHGSAAQKYIVGLQDTHSDATAAAALGAYLNGPTSSGYQDFQAAVLMSVYAEGFSKRTSGATRKALGGLEQQYRLAISETHKERERLFAENKDQSQAIEDAAQQGHDKRNNECSEALASQKSAFDAAMAEFKETQKFYEEYMEVNASHEYWKNKATNHKTAATKSKDNLIIFAVGISIGLITVLVILMIVALKIATPETPAAVYLILATVGLVATTGVLWTARILTRIYLSEHHLAIDAEERAIMAKTFIALGREDAVEKSERQIVLAALFRPTADGIVKDDAAPELSLSSLITRNN